MDEGQRPIYLDMQATTPLDPRVLDAMLPFYSGLYGNPHSRTHAYGWETEKAVEQAREYCANLIGADPKEIIFTSGATESNNMSIKGVARFFGRGGKKRHIITSQTEHKCGNDDRHGFGIDAEYPEQAALPGQLIYECRKTREEEQHAQHTNAGRRCCRIRHSRVAIGRFLWPLNHRAKRSTNDCSGMPGTAAGNTASRERLNLTAFSPEFRKSH